MKNIPMQINHKEYDKSEIERKKLQLEAENLKQNQFQTAHIKDKFGGSHDDILEEKFKDNTVGLLTREDFQFQRENIDSIVKKDYLKKLEEEIDRKKKNKLVRKRQYQTRVSQLSFTHEEEEEKDEEIEEVDDFKENPEKRRNFGKNPTIDTSFLPDKDREEKEREEQKKLMETFMKEQNIIKNQFIEITYIYWDGANLKKKFRLQKKKKISEFLELVRQDLSHDYSELRNMKADGLLYVLDDMIIPLNYSFYDLITQKVTSSHGLLFELEKRVEKDGNNVYEYEVNLNKIGKIIEKKSYERNKHIYPCSLWEPMDTSKYVAITDISHI